MIKKLGAILLVAALALSMGLVPAVAAAQTNEECVRYGQGYWKQWLADSANDVSGYLPGHTNEDLLERLNTPARRGNADVILSYQFIASALNKAVYGCEMPDAVQDAFDAAKAHLHGGEVSDDRSEILGWKDILEFWNENQYAELLSVVYEGTCTLFGTHIDDKITFTFSNDVFHDPDVEILFQTAMRLWEGWGADNWTMDGNTATVTLNRLYSSPRDIIGDKVVGIVGMVDFIGNPVVIPDGGVEVVAMTYHYHWGPGFPYGATADVFAVAIVNSCGMHVWWYSDGSLISEGWYHDEYSIAAMSGWSSGNPANWNEPVKNLFGVHFPDVTLAWYSRTAINVGDVPEPEEGSILLS